ncbi:hypothetical protein [Candidatus Regiella endosymbiont of Tuberolachnus salignus]
MSVDKLRDSASTCRQRRRNLKGEGYRLKDLSVAFSSITTGRKSRHEKN